ncbi:uncharacterized protein LOC110637487 isoform X2 [Hevea brasiliensis]|uniref:uncharacterized protein LOC110637487 isoform X2 n=1 Tax=Hevea brasiliensis TaxID=3981 RepID=UPI0025FBBFB7|nr:uncharacterized protein LOC110637487 isoform X2 [Hevea brasiliensis]
MKVLQDSAEIKFSTQRSLEPPGGLQNNAPKALGIDSGSVSVSSNNGRKVTFEDIEAVQNLIERCLQLYMNRTEVVSTLLHQARIEPGFTTLVWQKLEEENVDFFKAYCMRLALKRQIIIFNQLLEHQYQLMKMKSPVSPKVPLASIENGIQRLPVNNLPMGYTILQQPSIPSTGNSQISSVGSVSSCHVVNGVLASDSFHPMQINSLKGPADPVPAVPVIKSEMMDLSPTPVTSNGQFLFTPAEISGLSVDASALDSAYASHITSPEGLQLGPDSDTDNCRKSLEPVCQIHWNLSFSDLTAGLANVEDHGHLGNCSGSDILLDSPEQNDIGEDFFLDNVPAPGNQMKE